MRVAAAILLLACGTAAADPDSDGAKAQANAAAQLAAAHDYAGAAVKFRAAHRLDPRPEYLCNVGVAYQRAKMLPRAQIYLGECLLRGATLDAKFIGIVRQGLGTVEDKLRAGEFTPLDIAVAPPGAVVTISDFDPDEQFVGSRVLWVPHGSHTITVAAEGYATEHRTVEAKGHDRQALRFELHREAHQDESKTPVVTAPATPDGPASPVSPSANRVHRSKLPAVIATTGTVAAGVGAALVYFHAKTIMNGAGSTTISRSEYDGIVDRAHRWQYGSWALAGLTGVAAVASGLLWYRASATTIVEVSPAPGGAAVGVWMTW